MNNRIQVSIFDAIRINNSKKEFILFNTINDKMTDFRLTNNIDQWYKHYDSMRLTDVIKKEIKYLSINN